MYHPLYYQAKRYVGRPVYAYHMNGSVYHGTLHMVARSGVYIMNCRPVSYLASMEQGDASSDVSPELVYSPGAYFAFGALTGLTLGALVWFW